ncbi:hypothetical protein TIFTF001_016521 [Ficus carica]|uniref:Uncharacterized protein n=1 Tax=Ficus carica TaxID=3494 RepID=A0AA88A6F9_FICCA|nr:hypothetical protein TIFTF001_016521 [Ficus carica]
MQGLFDIEYDGLDLWLCYDLWVRFEMLYLRVALYFKCSFVGGVIRVRASIGRVRFSTIGDVVGSYGELNRVSSNGHLLCASVYGVT